MPRVTVYIPSYNLAPFLGAAIESVRSQTFTDWELVITDDASTDDSVGVARKHESERVRCFAFEENRGASAAANFSISQGTGEYIAPLSADDVFRPEKLAQQVAFLDAHPEFGAVFGIPDFMDASGAEITGDHAFAAIFTDGNRTREEWLQHFFKQGNCLCHTTAMYRRSVFAEVGPYEERLTHLPDFDFWVRLCLRHPLHILPEKLTRFRIRNLDVGNLSAPSSAKHAATGIELHHVLRHFLTPEGMSAIIGSSDEKEAQKRLRLAEAALQVGDRAHDLFALETMEETSLEGLDERERIDFIRSCRRHFLTSDICGRRDQWTHEQEKILLHQQLKEQHEKHQQLKAKMVGQALKIEKLEGKVAELKAEKNSGFWRRLLSGGRRSTRNGP